MRTGVHRSCCTRRDVIRCNCGGPGRWWAREGGWRIGPNSRFPEMRGSSLASVRSRTPAPLLGINFQSRNYTPSTDSIERFKKLSKTFLFAELLWLLSNCTVCCSGVCKWTLNLIDDDDDDDDGYESVDTRYFGDIRHSHGYGYFATGILRTCITSFFLFLNFISCPVSTKLH